MRKLLIDTDTASDDAVALIMAHNWADRNFRKLRKSKKLPHN